MLDEGAGFSRDSRLLKPAQYRCIFSDPTRTTDDCFTVLCRPSDRVTPRLGLAISKKCVRLAVDRNRIKRVIRESFRRNKSELGGVDYVVLSRKGTATMGNQALFNSLERHWQRLNKKAVTKND